MAVPPPLDHVRIPLRLTPGWKTFHVVIGVLSGILALGGLLSMAGVDGQEPGIKDFAIGGVGAAFFSVASFLIFRTVRHEPGYFIRSEEGLVVDTISASGLIGPGELEEARPVSWFGQRFVGLRLADRKRFVEGADSLRLEHASHVKAAVTVMRLSLAIRKLLPTDILFSLMGMKKIPDTLTPETMLEFNRENLGADVLIWTVLVPDPAGLIEELNADRFLRDPANRLTGAEPASGSAGDRPSVVSFADLAPGKARATKTCPMCAEDVLAAARICRFCRHSFGEAAA